MSQSPRPTRTSRAPARSRKPSLRIERALHREGHRVVAGMDEVGRGALAGPVSVGVVVIDESVRSAPVGLRDSKLLPAHKREDLVAPVRRWAIAYGVGHAGPHEIDAVGIMTALRLAGRRALRAAGVRPDLLVLDGNHDWLTDPARDGLLQFADEPEPEPRMRGIDDVSDAAHLWRDLPVRTIIKGDMTCSSVAAASILAKVERDGLMVELSQRHPAYGWAVNKGYAAPEHRAALLRDGACPLHRRSWNLLAAPDDAAPTPAAGPEAAATEPSAQGADDRAADAGEAGAPAADPWVMMCVDDDAKVGGR